MSKLLDCPNDVLRIIFRHHILLSRLICKRLCSIFDNILYNSYSAETFSLKEILFYLEDEKPSYFSVFIRYNNVYKVERYWLNDFYSCERFNIKNDALENQLYLKIRTQTFPSFDQIFYNLSNTMNKYCSGKYLAPRVTLDFQTYYYLYQRRTLFIRLDKYYLRDKILLKIKTWHNCNKFIALKKRDWSIGDAFIFLRQLLNVYSQFDSDLEMESTTYFEDEGRIGLGCNELDKYRKELNRFENNKFYPWLKTLCT